MPLRPPLDRYQRTVGAVVLIAITAGLFLLAAQLYRINTEDSAELRKMAGFRNVLVHGYTDVDSRIVCDVAANRLGDLEAFVAAVRERL